MLVAPMPRTSPCPGTSVRSPLVAAKAREGRYFHRVMHKISVLRVSLCSRMLRGIIRLSFISKAIILLRIVVYTKVRLCPVLKGSTLDTVPRIIRTRYGSDSGCTGAKRVER
nr:hypothetical protein CFP56_37258 [Quercus suber]